MFVYIIVTIIISLALIFVTFRFILPDVMKKAIEQLVQMSNEKLGAEKQDIKTDLDNKKSAFEKIARDIKELVEKTENKIDLTDRERIGSFSKLKEAVENQAKVTEQLSVTTTKCVASLGNRWQKIY